LDVFCIFYELFSTIIVILKNTEDWHVKNSYHTGSCCSDAFKKLSVLRCVVQRGGQGKSNIHVYTSDNFVIKMSFIVGPPSKCPV